MQAIECGRSLHYVGNRGSPIRDPRGLSQGSNHGAANPKAPGPASMRVTSWIFVVPDSWRTPEARALIAGCACSGLFIGTVCGWSSISGVLLADGVFAESEAPNENLLVVYSVTQCALSLSGPPAGLLCDRMPLVYGVAASGTCVIIASLIIGALPASAGFGFLPPFVLLAVGGNTCFFAAIKLQFFFPEAYRPTIAATICALYDASSVVSLLFFLAYQAGFSREAIFTSYGIFGALMFGSWAWTVAKTDTGARSDGNDDYSTARQASSLAEECGSPTTMHRSHHFTETTMHRSPSFTEQTLAVASLVTKIHRSPSFTSQSVSVGSCCAAQDGATPLLPVYEAPEESINGPAHDTASGLVMAPPPGRGSVPALHDAPLLTQLSSSQLVVGLAWYLFSQQRINLYLGTARVMLLAQGDSTGYYASLHTALLPAGLAFVPLIAVAHTRYGVVGTLQLSTLMGGLHGVCALYLPLDWQWITFCLFTCLRMATFAVFSIYTAEAFGPTASGTLTGFIFLVGGLASLSLVPIGSYVAYALHGDWAFVYCVYTLLCLPQLALVSTASWYWERRPRSAPWTPVDPVLGLEKPLGPTLTMATTRTLGIDACVYDSSDEPYREFEPPMAHGT